MQTAHCKMLIPAESLELRCVHDLVLRLLLKPKCYRRIIQSVRAYRGCRMEPQACGIGIRGVWYTCRKSARLQKSLGLGRCWRMPSWLHHWKRRSLRRPEAPVESADPSLVPTSSGHWRSAESPAPRRTVVASHGLARNAGGELADVLEVLL